MPHRTFKVVAYVPYNETVIVEDVSPMHRGDGIIHRLVDFTMPYPLFFRLAGVDADKMPANGDEVVGLMFTVAIQ